MAEITDAEILQQFRSEQTRERAFTQLVKKYQERLYYHIRRMVIDHDDANDVIQNMFIKVWHGLNDFREEAQLFTWLYRIATNEAITFINSKKRRGAVDFDDVSHYLSQKLSTGKYFNGDEIEQKLQQAIIKLPEKQRIVFNLRYYDEMPYEQMSRVLDTSEGALKASYHHAVRKVEEYLLKN